jgi:predicted dehydrogenase
MTSPPPVSLSVAGAGLIGRRHIEAIAACPGTRLASIVDPSAEAAAYAASLGVPHFKTLADMIAAGKPDGVVLATPNQLHVDGGMECIAAGLPVLVEKPLATSVADGKRLVDAGLSAGVPVLTGHHRRHNPLIAAAKARLDEGVIGTPVAAHGMFWLYKPEEYFETEWRRMPGAGPVLLNLIHDIDLMRYFCGEVESVHAVTSNAVRGNPVEETAAIVLTFASGLIGTFSVSDTIVAPWSWELTAAENPAYVPTGQFCYLIGGTHGSLELPNAKLWTNPGKRSWMEPVEPASLSAPQEDPLDRQIAQFAAVIRGEEQPLVSGLEGLKSLQVIEAVRQSAQTGRTITIEPL